MLNLNKFCSLFIGLILSVVCALPLSARDINAGNGDQYRGGTAISGEYL